MGLGMMSIYQLISATIFICFRQSKKLYAEVEHVHYNKSWLGLYLKVYDSKAKVRRCHLFYPDVFLHVIITQCRPDIDG